tara:strand:- start:323 stop:763 length:441 start_codon:yes stop_codon:yes gene_type:complete
MKIIEPSDNIKEILENDKSQNKLSFFYFTASWCGPCQRIFPVLLTLENEYNKSIKKEEKIKDTSEDTDEDTDEDEIDLSSSDDEEEKVEEKVVFYKIDIDENDEYASECNIRSVPTFYLFNGTEKLGETTGANIQKIGELLKENLK